MITNLALIVVCLAGAYLVALGLAALFRRTLAENFLSGFATSSLLHFVEISIRIIVGAALVLAAPRLFPTILFTIVGWILVVTSVVMLFVPWELHRRFAAQSVPRALPFLSLIGVVSLVAGGALMWLALTALAGNY
jgi:hypothetical protein